MNPLDYPDKGIKYDKKVYKTIFPYYCPEKYPYLCTKASPDTGLCKKTLDDCKINVITDSEILLTDEDEKYTVIDMSMMNNCGKVRLDLEEDYSGETPLNISRGREKNDKESQENILPTTILPYGTINEEPINEILHDFTIMTYNIDLTKFRNNFPELIKLRIDAIIKVIEKNNPDILCLQGVNNTSYKILKENLNHIYPYIYEKDFYIRMNKNLEVMILSKYKPLRIKLYTIEGVIGYDNSFMIIEFKDIIIINCSLGIEDNYDHNFILNELYSAQCRKQELHSIGSLIDVYIASGKAVILVGDFAFNLNNKIASENIELNNMDVKNVWSLLHDEKITTSNIDLSSVSVIEKPIWSDGIFYKNPSNNNQIILPEKIRLTGRRPLILKEAMATKFIENLKDDNINFFNNEKGTISIYPAEHFALITTFKVLNPSISFDANSETVLDRSVKIREDKS